MILNRYKLYLVLPLVVICSLIFLLMLIQRMSSLSIWDDAYFFIRYADNLLQYGQLTWNPDMIPTYGLTSPAYLLMVVPIRIIFPSQPALVMLLSSLLSGIITFVLMSFLTLRIIKDPIHRLILLCIAMISIIVASDHITTHLTSGMDTMFALACLTLWLYSMVTSQATLKVGIFAGLFFWIRPDVLLIVGSIGLLKYRTSHSQLRRFIIGFLAILFLQLTINVLYFNQLLPSPFYAKNLPIYGDAFYGFYENSSREFFVQFIMSYPYLYLICFLAAIHNMCVRLLLVSLVPICLYQVFFVVPIMGFSQRFYYPIIPVIWLTTMYSVPINVKRIPISVKLTFRNYPMPQFFVPVLLLLALINPMPLIVTLIQYSEADDPPVSFIGNFDIYDAYNNRYIDNWYRLDRVSELDSKLVIATTEVGLPSVMNPDKMIIDLAGLNDIQYIDNTSFIDRLLYQSPYPDWIYMPFPHYERMWYSIYDDTKFKEEYDYFNAQSLGTSMDVAIRQSSPFYIEMLEILTHDE